MANTKKITVDQLSQVVKGCGANNDARFLKLTDKGALATLDEVAKAQLAAALKDEIEGKADSATTISGYGITDAYTKTEVDAKIVAAYKPVVAAYKPGGSIAPSAVAAALLVAANEGKVYDLNADLTLDATTAALFVDGSVGEKFPEGSNIAVINTAADGETAVYKFDALPGFVDLSNYATLDDVEAASAADIQAIINGQYAA